MDSIKLGDVVQHKHYGAIGVVIRIENAPLSHLGEPIVPLIDVKVSFLIERPSGKYTKTKVLRAPISDWGPYIEEGFATPQITYGHIMKEFERQFGTQFDIDDMRPNDSPNQIYVWLKNSTVNIIATYEPKTTTFTISYTNKDWLTT